MGKCEDQRMHPQKTTSNQLGVVACLWLLALEDKGKGWSKQVTNSTSYISELWV